MNVHARRALPALAVLLALSYGCTQDFDQFEPAGAAGPAGTGPAGSSAGPGGTGGAASSSGPGGTGGGASASSSTAASTGQGGAGGVGGAGGIGGGGGVGGSPVEDCLDGIDNDGDAMPDCADSDCGNFECTDPAPTGWEGFFRINTTPYPNNMPTACPDGSTPAAYFDTPNPGDCSACTCGMWGSAVCAGPTLTCWNQSNSCMGNQFLDLSGLATDGSCYNVPGIPNQNARSCALTAAPTVADQGSCPASGGAPLFPEPWMNQDDACGQPIAGGSGCGGQQVCVPSGGGDYNGPVCIRIVGNDVCPAAYPNLVEAATGEADDRMCSACQCTPSGVTCSGGSYLIDNTDDCPGNDAVTVDSMSCVNVTQQLDNNTGAISLNSMPQAAGGSCTPSGGQASGSVTPQGAVTFCCK